MPLDKFFNKQSLISSKFTKSSQEQNIYKYNIYNYYYNYFQYYQNNYSTHDKLKQIQQNLSILFTVTNKTIKSYVLIKKIYLYLKKKQNNNLY